jgi:hypothetical protein
LVDLLCHCDALVTFGDIEMMSDKEVAQRKHILELILKFRQQIEECPYCATIRKEMVKLCEVIPLEPIIMAKEDILPCLLKVLK